MPSQPSDILKLELQEAGENENIWGDKANDIFQRVEEAVTGAVSVAVGAADVTLSDTNYVENQSRYAVLRLTGLVEVARSVTVPQRAKLYVIDNATTGAGDVTVKTSADSGVVVPKNELTHLFVNASGVRRVTSDDRYVLSSAIDGIIETAIDDAKSELYPVGSIYENASVSTNPATLLGFGTWSSLGAGRVTVGAGGSYSAGATGGSETVTLTTNQIPSHAHGSGNLSTSNAGSHSHGGNTSNTGSHSHTYFGSGGNKNNAGGGGGVETPNTAGNRSTESAGAHSHNIATNTSGAHSHNISGNTSNAGGGEAHDNMMPYLVVYRWVRTA